MRTLFFGTSDFAVPSLRVLAERTAVAGVVTQPDRPSGRGQRVTPSPVKAAAIELGLPVYQPSTLRALQPELAGDAFDLFALASYGRLIPDWLLELPRLGSLNVHPSLLPAYRGATPIQTALRNGERATGVTVMLMDAGMDTGDVVLQEPVTIDPDEDYGHLHDRLATIGAALLGRALELAANGRLPTHPQTGEPTYTHPLGKDDLSIDWSWEPRRIVDAVRAFSPLPGARAQLEGEIVKVLRAHVEDGRVEIDELIAPNRGRMSGAAYLRGRTSHER
ncbi:MAG TPA: methionyl-tRNA formyltransferase [Candidatus Tumulicola sp.]